MEPTRAGSAEGRVTAGLPGSLAPPPQAPACSFQLASSGSYQTAAASCTNSSSFSEVKKKKAHGSSGKCLDKNVLFIS